MGNFDGVHLGHQAVIGAALAAARAAGAPALAVTFEPHPRRLFQPGLPPFRLTPPRAKLELLSDLGLDAALVLRFDKRLAAEEADHFVERILVSALAARYVVIGHDFNFGRGRGGSPATLAAAGRRLDFAVTAVPAQSSADGETYSSTSIRAHLQAGEPRRAAALLGRPWRIAGPVRHGDKRGRTIGFPTANLALGTYLRPMAGVYAVRATIGGRQVDGVANIGNRPTVDGQDFRLEAHLFDFAEDIYGLRLGVDLIAFLRPEMRFPGLDALTAQIARDVEAARQALA